MRKGEENQTTTSKSSNKKSDYVDRLLSNDGALVKGFKTYYDYKNKDLTLSLYSDAACSKDNKICNLYGINANQIISDVLSYIVDSFNLIVTKNEGSDYPDIDICESNVYKQKFKKEE